MSPCFLLNLLELWFWAPILQSHDMTWGIQSQDCSKKMRSCSFLYGIMDLLSLSCLGYVMAEVFSFIYNSMLGQRSLTVGSWLPDLKWVNTGCNLSKFKYTSWVVHKCEVKFIVTGDQEPIPDSKSLPISKKETTFPRRTHFKIKTLSIQIPTRDNWKLLPPC